MVAQRSYAVCGSAILCARRLDASGANTGTVEPIIPADQCAEFTMVVLDQCTLQNTVKSAFDAWARPSSDVSPSTTDHGSPNLAE